MADNAPPETPQAASGDESPVSTPSLLSASMSDELGTGGTLAGMVAQANAIKSYVEQVLGALSPGELKRYGTQLDDFKTLLRACTDAVPVAAPSSYFELVPKGPLENITRCLSARPRSLEWTKHVDPADAEILYLGDGALCDAFRLAFTNVELQTLPTATRTADMYLRTRNWTAGANDVLKRAGQHFKALTYSGDSEPNSPPHLVSWIDPFRRYCDNVIELHLNKVHTAYFDMILEARAGKLEKLYLDSCCSSRNHLFVVARHCAGLKSLCMQPRVSVPDSLWTSLAPSLTELELAPTMKCPPPRDVLKAVQASCRALTHVTVGKDYIAVQLAELLISYGAQLLFAKAGFGLMPFPQCQNIADACPNAMFEISSSVKFEVVAALKYRMHNLKLGKPILEPMPPNFFESFDMLRSLTLTFNDGDAGWFLSSLFRSPKPELTELTVSSVQDNPMELLSILATRTTSIRKLRLWCKDLPVEGLGGVVDANKLLDKLTFKVRNADGYRVHEVVRICYRCESLRELKIIKLPNTSLPPQSRLCDTVAATAQAIARTADVCMPLRRRNTYVQIFNVDYLM